MYASIDESCVFSLGTMKRKPLMRFEEAWITSLGQPYPRFVSRLKWGLTLGFTKESFSKERRPSTSTLS